MHPIASLTQVIPHFGDRASATRKQALQSLDFPIEKYFPSAEEQQILNRLLRAQKPISIAKIVTQLADFYHQKGNLYLSAQFKTLASSIAKLSPKMEAIKIQNRLWKAMAIWACQLQDPIELECDPRSVMPILLKHYPNDAKTRRYHTRFLTPESHLATAIILRKLLIYIRTQQKPASKAVLASLYNLGIMMELKGQDRAILPIYRYLLDVSIKRRYDDNVERIADELGWAYTQLRYKKMAKQLGEEINLWRNNHPRSRK